MKHTKTQERALAFLLIPCLLAVPAPVLAATSSTTTQTIQAAAQQTADTYTLGRIVEQMQQHNRVGKQYELNLKLLDESQTKAKNAKKDLQSTLNTVYDKETDAYNSLSTVGKSQAQVKAGMAQIEQSIRNAHPTATEAEIQGLLLNNSTYMSLQAQLTSLTGMESQLTSGISTAESSLDQLWDGIDQADTTLRSLENKQDDVTKSQADWNEEIKLVANLLVRKTITMEETQSLLEQKAALLQKQLNVSKKQEEVGLTVPVKTKDVQLSIQENDTQLQQVKDGIQLLKRQINDLMGRSLDATLNIVPIEEENAISAVPVYSAELLKQVTDKDYTLKTLQRDIDNYKEDAQDLKDKGNYESDTLKIYDLDIELSKVSIQNQQAALDNDLKKLIDSVNVAGQTYAEKINAWNNATTKYNQNKKYKEVGLISPLTFEAADLEYQQSALSKKQAAYDYALAKLEYEDFLKGIDLSIYEKYKGL